MTPTAIRQLFAETLWRGLPDKMLLSGSFVVLVCIEEQRQDSNRRLGISMQVALDS